MYIYRNPNPCKTLVGDCVIRAIAIAEDITWDTVYWALCDKGFSMCDMPSSNEVWGAYLSELGYKCYSVPFFMTVADFCNHYKTGTYVLGTGTHAIAVKDGSFFDTWNSQDERPVYYWHKEE